MRRSSDVIPESEHTFYRQPQGNRTREGGRLLASRVSALFPFATMGRGERAVCGFDVKQGGASIARDAANIRWVQAADPNEEANSLALCVLHK